MGDPGSDDMATWPFSITASIGFAPNTQEVKEFTCLTFGDGYYSASSSRKGFLDSVLGVYTEDSWFPGSMINKGSVYVY